ncbi:unnamed protein product [Cuscuta campestris]|uniref:tRNA:m(4)X modification enzyme TRM13 n=1 Tax=Cuscuta campestris TaxID=132261 RepID=A0A484MES3_9ASTE|nr:unnamed protein product [Cuscuta campestris]
MEAEEGRCKLWLPKKNRYCANSPLPSSPFCGNHTKRSDGQWIPCPIDSSHSVLKENLQSHLKRCPLLKQAQSLSLQPFYQKGVNAGADIESINGVSSLTSEMKRKSVYSMSVAQFSELIAKIRSVHASICNSVPDSFKISQACRVWIDLQADSKLPFEEKHVLQQASILGNLEDSGVLNRPGDDLPAVVEFGAGRGYLTQLLADCYRFKKVVFIERKPYKLKADRSLRQKEGLTLERLRIDIEDLNLKAVESLHGVDYLAIGKHLCGPATDMTLTCCNNDPVGLAIATCCHHLCQWRHYVSKECMLSLGISMEDFNALTWFTSWAVDADHGSDLDGTHFRISDEMADDPWGVEGICRNMKAVDRAALGFMCKDIIDAGRVDWLKKIGFECEFVRYVPSSISPENHLLVAWKRD